MRTNLLLAFVLALSTVMVRAQGPPQNPSQNQSTTAQSQMQSNAATRADTTLTDRINKALAHDSKLNNVQVIVNAGSVTLAGTVPTQTDKQDAQRLAEAVPGVTKVVNEITIGNSSLPPAGAPEVPRGDVQQSSQAAQQGCECPKGTGTQTGTYPGTNQPCSCPPGAQVNPKLPQGEPPYSEQPSATTEQSGPISTNQALSRIQNALRDQVPTAAEGIGVSITPENKIELTGTVATQDDKDRVASVATSAAPGFTIVNNLKVRSQSTTAMPNPPVSSAEGEAAAAQAAQSASLPQHDVVGTSADVQSRIQAAFQKDPSVSNSDIRVGVTKDTVELSGVVQSAQQEDKARSIAEQNAGGMQVIDHLQVTNTGKPPSPLSVPPRSR